MSDITAAVERRKNPQLETVRELIKMQEGAIKLALPRHIGAERFSRIVLTEVNRNKALLKCDPMSLLGAVMLSAQLGLELGPLGHAYLVPFKQQVTFIIGYQGMIELARRSGQVANVQAYDVYENDEFDYEFGLNPNIVHKPAEGDRGKLTHVYAVAKYKDAGYNFEVLTVDDVERYKKRSRSATSDHSPWHTDYEAMALKTAIRRLWRWLPKTPELSHAAMADEQATSTLAPIDTTVAQLGGGEEIEPDDPNVSDAELVDNDDDEEDPNADIAGMDEDTRWAMLADALAEVPEVGPKGKLIGFMQRLGALLDSVGLLVPTMRVTEDNSKDEVLAAVADYWDQARRIYADGNDSEADR